MAHETEEIKDIVRIIADEVNMLDEGVITEDDDVKNYRFWGFCIDIPVHYQVGLQFDIVVAHSHDDVLWITTEEIQYTDSGQELSKTYRKHRRYYRITVTNNSGKTINDVTISTRKGN